MALASLILMVRAAWVIIIPDFQFMTAFTFESSFFISTMVLQVVITVSFIMMNSERFERNLLLVESSLRVNVQLLEKAITERKRLEEERLVMERKLLHAQKLESLGVMAGGIANDFNNLLMAIMGNLEFALTDRGLGAVGKNAIENAIQASERSAELSHQMLIYSGKLFYVPKDLDLGELAFKLAHENEYLFNSVIPKTTTLNYKINKGLPLIRGDEDQIQRVIANLVLNAAEAIGDNNGEVNLTTGIMDCDESYLSGSRLEVKPDPGEFVFLEVTDTGCGMDTETQHRLFDPFFSTKFWVAALEWPR